MLHVGEAEGQLMHVVEKAEDELMHIAEEHPFVAPAAHALENFIQSHHHAPMTHRLRPHVQAH